MAAMENKQLRDTLFLRKKLLKKALLYSKSIIDKADLFLATVTQGNIFRENGVGNY